MRAAHRSFDLAVISCAVQIVFGVSGFAQSNSGYRTMAALDRTATSALREYVVNAPRDAWPDSVPPNLDPGVYRSVVQAMLRQSPTFRRQCWRIATASELTVTLQPANRPMRTSVRARTQVAREGRHLIAIVQIFRPEQPEELIAHELEHIIEQLDGVDLASRADAATSGVNRASSYEASFETVRATRIGLTVAAEMRRRAG